MRRGGAVEAEEAGEQDAQEGVGGEGVALFDGAVHGAHQAAGAGVVGDRPVEGGGAGRVPGGVGDLADQGEGGVEGGVRPAFGGARASGVGDLRVDHDEGAGPGVQGGAGQFDALHAVGDGAEGVALVAVAGEGVADVSGRAAGRGRAAAPSSSAGPIHGRLPRLSWPSRPARSSVSSCRSMSPWCAARIGCDLRVHGVDRWLVGGGVHDGSHGHASALDTFSPATRNWFAGAFPAPTAAQEGAWSAIGEGSDVLVVAPTGSGKTLAAFLSALDSLASAPPPAESRKRCRVLYVSPLKALAVDVERNLRSPLTGIRQEAVRLGLPEPEVRVGIRSGDTPAAERRSLATRPPDILITTPESLFLMLTSSAREALAGVETVILDEVHAVAGTKRGAHLALSLERLDELLPKPARRIGLSATVRPVDEVARFLSPRRRVESVQPASGKEFDLSVVVPVEDLGELGGSPVTDEGAGERPSIWPHVEERITDLIQSHRSTIVFANSRRLAERLCNRLNEIAYERATGETMPEDHSPPS
ncbi:hypothetical protein Sgou_00380 [Streptomyces gougerotii]|uniref:Helicase ATP-binding domain-containing protein n=1 Tax=Streptomyces gougerotii TaxID=53448 RepID=A0ABQ1CYI1_9ACTN|nr:hypothetical protein Sgou_00380 [Streptomyces gougerotii]